MKSEVKKKYRLKRQNANQTGASPIDLTFTPLEERIAAIVGKQLLDGDENVDEFGFGAATSSTENLGNTCLVISIGMCSIGLVLIIFAARPKSVMLPRRLVEININAASTSTGGLTLNAPTATKKKIPQKRSFPELIDLEGEIETIFLVFIN